MLSKTNPKASLWEQSESDYRAWTHDVVGQIIADYVDIGDTRNIFIGPSSITAQRSARREILLDESVIMPYYTNKYRS